MSAIYVMIGASLFLALGFLAAFIWSVKSNQYEDDYTPSVRILFEDKVPKSENDNNNNNNNNNNNQQKLN